MEKLGLMERFADPELFKTLTFGEKMASGAVTLVMGMGITFIILAIIWAAIALMGKFFKTTDGKKAGSGAAAAPAPKANNSAQITMNNGAAAVAPAADNALIAVIMAAIAAAEGDTSATFVNSLRIQRITRVTSERNAWSREGLNDCVDSRKW